MNARIRMLEKELSNARKSVVELEAMLKVEEDLIAEQVEVVKNDNSYTLKFKGRTLNVRKNTHNRFRVAEGRKVLDGDYLWGMKQLRCAIATGAI